ncbi:glycoside hydrolase family 95 protein [Parabacteroides sp. W1-Q-101]|nr:MULTISPECIES: glycoside hydrolase family 95 protein [unclassified Parabacteroides]MCM0718751.1 glycoside hydrolase family 95 protein [Parabacteroides sp. W1-Q-101]
MRQLIFIFFLFVLIGCTGNSILQTESSSNDLIYKNLSSTWDEAVPLGNGTVGALIWQKGQALRIALDRSDLWDLRPLDEFSGEQYTFKWVYDHVKKNEYKTVQNWYNLGGKGYAGPTKIPGAALEFDLSKMGELKDVHLYLNQAVCHIEWNNGMKFQTFVHACQPIGWFIAGNVGEDFIPSIIPPAYTEETVSTVNDHSEFSLSQLGYKKGDVIRNENKIVYEQVGWGNFKYKVAVKWEYKENMLTGVWCITSSETDEDASQLVDEALQTGIKEAYGSHLDWWRLFYAQSSIKLPDSVIEKQYYNELYKMGCIARSDSYPISLQSIWTADNGRLPPWKGDYHHDLNTQLSYWPYYTGNHLNEAYGYLETLWNQRETNKAYTKQYFGTNGLNVPGVCTLKGEPMGGWIQFSLGPTVSAWLSQHFYLHWKYSQDKDFLKERAYPYVKEVVTYLEEFMELRDGIRSLPLSSSPEYNDNRMDAWFMEMTNFDRALVRFAFMAASELALELGLSQEANHWDTILSQLPGYDLDKNGGLTIAPGHPYAASHRHFSHLLAIHPLGIIDKANGVSDSRIIDESIQSLDKQGSSQWCGYSFSWLANLKARAFDGEGAAQALRDFANCFCLPNTFHANGDQTNSGKSRFTYRPFTLEGNMAFAAGVQEMLLQSHTGTIRVFPAIPNSWKDVSFDKLRAMGAFLVSADRVGGKLSCLKIVSEKGGILRLDNPFKGEFVCSAPYKIQNKNILEVKMNVGDQVFFREK